MSSETHIQVNCAFRNRIILTGAYKTVLIPKMHIVAVEPIAYPATEIIFPYGNPDYCCCIYLQIKKEDDYGELIEYITDGDITTPLGVEDIYTMLNGSDIPLQSDALFWLDGTVLQDGEAFYLVDKLNGRNFTITGHDWTVSKGFPYKTSATMAAPVGDSTLIAEDINNFLYDSGGTPNEIPVISLFQDIDYEHKLFCRHAAQEVALDGVETYEPRVLDIVLYNTVKSGADLTECQTYYEVPTEVTSGVKWVSKTGNDANDGSKATPWITLQKAELSATAGDTIYIKTGVYIENDTTGSTNNFRAINNRKWCGIGMVTVKGSSVTTYTMSTSGNNPVEWNRLIIDANNSLDCVYGTAGTGAKQFNNCRFTGNTATSGSSALVYIIAALPVVYNNCIFDGLVGTTNFNMLRTRSVFTMSGCFFGSSITFYGIYDGSKQLAGTTSITYSKFNTVLNGIYPFIGLVVQEMHTFVCKFNVFNVYGAILIDNQLDVLIEKNIFNVPDTGDFATIDIESGVVMTSCKIQYNVINTDNITKYAIKVGTEVTSADDNNIKPEIIGNAIYGALIANPGRTGGNIHTLFVGHNIDPVIKYNLIKGSNLGIALKHTNQAYVNSRVFGNVIIDCDTPIVTKGVSGAKIYNNTIYNENVAGAAFKTENPSSFVCTDIDLRNNIMVNFADSGTGLINISNGDESGLICNNNVMYSIGTLIASYQDANKTWAQWQALGFDANSINSDPQLTNYIPSQSSPAIGSGVDLGENYEDCLDITTNWGDPISIPEIVTKQQPATWDCGAYVR